MRATKLIHNHWAWQVSNSPFLFAVMQTVCSAGTGRIPDSKGTCICPGGTSPVSSGGDCVSLGLLVPFAAAVLMMTAFVARRRFRRRLSKEEEELRRAVRSLRQRLHLTWQEGILVSSDRVLPFWRPARSMVFVQQSSLV